MASQIFITDSFPLKDAPWLYGKCSGTVNYRCLGKTENSRALVEIICSSLFNLPAFSWWLSVSACPTHRSGSFRPWFVNNILGGVDTWQPGLFSLPWKYAFFWTTAINITSFIQLQVSATACQKKKKKKSHGPIGYQQYFFKYVEVFKRVNFINILAPC